jgi:hypothetical protein
MKNLILSVLVLATIPTLAQFNTNRARLFLEPYQFNVKKMPKLDLKWHQVMNHQTEPSLKPSFHIDDQFNINSQLPLGNDYWIGKTTNFYSEDGGFKATYTYDLLGNVRNSSLSFSLKKKN